MMSNVSLQEVIGQLESLFSKFNKKFFDGQLEKPVITISPDTTRGAYGWCTSWKAWKQGGGKILKVTMKLTCALNI